MKKPEKRFDFVEKKVYSTPVAVELSFLSPYMNGSTLKRMDDERLVISQLSFSWIELCFGIAMIIGYFHIMDIVNKRVDEEFERQKSIATREIFYKIEDYADENGYVVKTIRQPNEREQKIIDKYRELGEKGYRKYLMSEDPEGHPVPQTLGFIGLFGLGSVFTYLGLPKRKRFVFNRKEGTATFPRFMNLGSYKRPFSEVNFIYARLGMSVVERKSLAILHPNGVTRTFLNMQFPERFLSFYVWYMDKNRPLPPGSAFNPYRERDYDRRMAAGFPAPLYPSLVDTPEWEGSESMEQREEYRKQVEKLIKDTEAKKDKHWLVNWMYEKT